MKRQRKISLCGVSAALSVVFMLLGYFPYFTYAAPAVAGLCMMIPVMEIGLSWAWGTYFVSSFLTLLFCEREAGILFVLFLGYYPILKALIERIRLVSLEWLFKVLSFAVGLSLCAVAWKLFLSVSLSDFGVVGTTGFVLLVVFLLIVFVIYDVGLSRLSAVYHLRLHPIFKKMFRS